MSRVTELVGRILVLDRPLLIALDVDGTISPIVRDPDTAEIPEQTLATLQALTEARGIELALVTGRDFDSLKRMERLEGIWRAVEHGGQVLAPGEAPRARSLTVGQRAALDRFREWVDNHAPDAFVEYKPQAIALHVRGIAMRDPQRAEQLMNEADVLAQSLGLHVRRGKALREAEAVQNDKGRALEELLDRSGARSVFFVGDDLTDFPAIEVANTRGVGAFVQSHEQRRTPSGEAARLSGVDEVHAVLQRLLEGIHG